MMMAAMRRKVWNGHEMRRTIESLPSADYLAFFHFERWLAALCALAVEKGLVPLPTGHYALLAWLGIGTNGNHPGSAYMVQYMDATAEQHRRDVSDWLTPQGYIGESIALVAPYRLSWNGTREVQPFNLYAYALPLNAAKIVASVDLPEDTNLEIIAITLATWVPATLMMRIVPSQVAVNPGDLRDFLAVLSLS